ncbi:MAG: DUF2141 domain-containing protein [Ignavibacteriae bacterium]|nr:DUF2141 domain-containing protein [Ignavibacteriota bacterium]
MKILFLFLIVNISVLAQSSKLNVKIINLENRDGDISIGIFNRSENFPKRETGKMGVSIPINKSWVEHTFTNLEKGKYAVAVYHDENKNGELDRSLFGWPTEDYIFSNYAKGSFGPPSFEDASFYLKDSLTIELEFDKK